VWRTRSSASVLLRLLPNLVSVSRFLLTPFAVAAIVAGNDRQAFWLSLIAGATDFLDGGLARALKVVSHTGAILDPLADKFMLDCLYLALWWMRGEWVGLVVVARDLMIVGGSLYIHRRSGRRDFPPSWWGKLSTVLQIGWILMILGDAPGISAGRWMMLAATAGSGFDYFRIGLNMLRDERASGN
jgi:cardiolipin synthase